MRFIWGKICFQVKESKNGLEKETELERKDVEKKGWKSKWMFTV